MGQAIVGFDYQVFRTTPPPPDMVEHAKPDGPVAAADGGRLTIGLPGLDGEVDPVDGTHDETPPARPGGRAGRVAS